MSSHTSDLTGIQTGFALIRQSASSRLRTDIGVLGRGAMT